MTFSTRLARLQKISRLLDDQFEGPFGIRFGLDPLIGLIPILGDALTSLVSLYIVLEAYHMGCGVAILLRMLFNIFLEDFLKVIPIFGQLFDFYWKSNAKNMHLLSEHLQAPVEVRKKSILFLSVLVLGFLFVMTAVLALTIWLGVYLAGLLRF